MGAAKGLDSVVVLDVHFGEAEVGKFDVAAAINEDVIGLEVTVDDVLVVKVLEGEKDLNDIDAGDVLCEPALLLEGHVQVSARVVLKQ